MKYKVDTEEFDNWTDAQHKALKLLDSNIEFVRVFQWDSSCNKWFLIQELNLKRGILPNPNFSTWTLAPYFVRKYLNSSEINFYDSIKITKSTTCVKTVNIFEENILKLS